MKINERIDHYLSENKSNALLNALQSSLSNDELKDLKDAVYKISDGYQKIKEINQSMKKNKKWRGQGDLAAMEKNLKELTSDGQIGLLLKLL